MLSLGFVHILVSGCVQLCDFEENRCFEFEHRGSGLYGHTFHR